jgi:O-antigen/teichoic acid export membrane protein
MYSYAGVIIGFITTGWLMPKFLAPEEIGVIRLVQYYALFISSILGMGIPQSLIKLFPHFKNNTTKHYGVISLISIMTFLGLTIFAIVFLRYGPTFFQQDFKNSALFHQFYSLILPFTVATVLFTLYDSYAMANKEATIGVFLKDFVLRILNLALLGCFIFFPEFLYPNFITSLTYVQYIPVLLIIVFLAWKRFLPLTHKVSFPTSQIRNEFFSVTAFNWINGLASVAVVTIDSIMISKIVNPFDVGIYTTVTFYASILMVPIRSLGKIATSVISQHFKDNTLSAIESIYKKSALTLFIIGLFIFGNLLFGLPFIFTVVLNPAYASGYWVLIFLALSNLFNMSTGIKFAIIFTSEYYKWSTLMFIGYLVLIVGTNFLFIPIFGIIGAAIASLLASSLFHLSGLIFVKVKFGYWPFTHAYIKVAGVFLPVMILLFLIPSFNYPVITGILKAAIFSSIFMLLIYKFNISSDLNIPLNNFIKKMRK